MSNRPLNASGRAHRAQLVAEAVISAYIHEIAQPESASPAASITEDTPAIAISHWPRAARARRREPAPRALELPVAA